MAQDVASPTRRQQSEDTGYVLFSFETQQLRSGSTTCKTPVAVAEQPCGGEAAVTEGEESEHLTARNLPSRGVSPVHSSQMMTPTEKMSTFSEKGLLTRSSGACHVGWADQTHGPRP